MFLHWNPPACTVFDGNRAFLSNKTYFEHCAEKLTGLEATKLLVQRVGECPLQWISPAHRATFYRTCLDRNIITPFRRRVISAANQLEGIAFAQKAETQNKGSTGGGVFLRDCSATSHCRSKSHIEDCWKRHCLCRTHLSQTKFNPKCK